MIHMLSWFVAALTASPLLALSSYYNSDMAIFYGIDPLYLFLVLPTILLALFAQLHVKNTFSKYSLVPARSGFTGRTAARAILEKNGLMGVMIERTAGRLTDHYDPRSQTLRLSEATFDHPSIAAIGVAAHEAGHAVQHQEGYLPNELRTLLVPVAQIGSTIGPYLAMFGIIMSISFLIDIGIVLFLGAVLFYLVTLPVEFNASRRAIESLKSEGILDTKELAGARKVLNAAALTYIASTLTAFASLLRLILLSRSRRNRD